MSSIRDDVRERERIRMLEQKMRLRGLEAVNKKIEQQNAPKPPPIPKKEFSEILSEYKTTIVSLGLLVVLGGLCYGLWILMKPPEKTITASLSRHKETLVEVCVPNAGGPPIYRSPSFSDKVEMFVPMRGQTLVVDATLNINGTTFKRGIIMVDRDETQRGDQVYVIASGWNCQEISAVDGSGFRPSKR